MFRVIQLFVFVFVFGRIVHRTIRIRPNSLKPLFGTSLISGLFIFNGFISSIIVSFLTLFLVFMCQTKLACIVY